MARDLAWPRLLVLLAGVCCASAAGTVQPIPSVLYGSLFRAAQLGHVYSDQKTFCDAFPLAAPSEIVASWANHTGNLAAFVSANFAVDVEAPVHPPANQTLREHIEWLWPALTRLTNSSNSSLVPLPNAYVVPGSRFTETYYWDSYFIFLGLRGRHQALVEGMIGNFAHLIRTYGFIGNGNRNYYQSRSQPPFFSLMVSDMSSQPLAAFGDALGAEYAFWMAPERVVAMGDGSTLNRYRDALDIPRDESYAQDVETCRVCRGGADCATLWRDLRTAAETGWDFSSRWLGNKSETGTLCSIRTTQIVPVDLNALLYHLETTLANSCTDNACRVRFKQAAAARAATINKYLWCNNSFYCDYDAGYGRAVADNPSAAMMYPLWLGVADAQRANLTALTLSRTLLRSGGIVTTTYETGQQWDYPMGWAPLQWVAIEGLRRYRMAGLADVVGSRFLATVSRVYASQGKLVEKYNVVTPSAGGGGEYPLADGFGWTNGVTMALLDGAQKQKQQ